MADYVYDSDDDLDQYETICALLKSGDDDDEIRASIDALIRGDVDFKKHDVYDVTRQALKERNVSVFIRLVTICAEVYIESKMLVRFIRLAHRGYADDSASAETKDRYSQIIEFLLIQHVDESDYRRVVERFEANNAARRATIADGEARKAADLAKYRDIDDVIDRVAAETVATSDVSEAGAHGRSRIEYIKLLVSMLLQDVVLLFLEGELRFQIWEYIDANSDETSAWKEGWSVLDQDIIESGFNMRGRSHDLMKFIEVYSTSVDLTDSTCGLIHFMMNVLDHDADAIIKICRDFNITQNSMRDYNVGERRYICMKHAFLHGGDRVCARTSERVDDCGDA
jgi:hypothetical protein